MLALPCPKCGEVGNFNGWGSDNAYQQLSSRKEVYDDWSAMKYVADYEGVEWKPSPNNHWCPNNKKDKIKNLEVSAYGKTTTVKEILHSLTNEEIQKIFSGIYESQLQENRMAW